MQGVCSWRWGVVGVNEVAAFLARGIPVEMVQLYAHLVICPDGADAGGLVEQLAADGVPAEAIMLELLAPAARQLGDMWCGDRLGFVEVTIGLSRIQQQVRQFRIPAGSMVADKGRVLLAPVPGEQHSFGLRVVEEFLLRDGWEVRAVLRPLAGEVAQLAAADPYDIVGFSVSGERLLPALRQAIREVRAASRNRSVRIMVGGVLFAGPAPCGHLCDADATVSDAREAVARANEWYALAGVT